MFKSYAKCQVLFPLNPSWDFFKAYITIKYSIYTLKDRNLPVSRALNELSKLWFKPFQIRKYLCSLVVVLYDSWKHDAQTFSILISGLLDGVEIRKFYKWLYIYFYPIGSLCFFVDEPGTRYIWNFFHSFEKATYNWRNCSLTSTFFLVHSVSWYSIL